MNAEIGTTPNNKKQMMAISVDRVRKGEILLKLQFEDRVNMTSTTKGDYAVKQIIKPHS